MVSVLGGGTKTLAGAIVQLKRTKVNQCSRYLRTEHQTPPDNYDPIAGKFLKVSETSFKKFLTNPF